MGYSMMPTEAAFVDQSYSSPPATFRQSIHVKASSDSDTEPDDGQLSPHSRQAKLQSGSTTLDLVEFLKQTGPSDEQLPKTHANRPIASRKKSPFSFIRTHRPTSKPLRLQKPITLPLPDSVVAKTSIQGKRYLQIAVPLHSDGDYVSNNRGSASYLLQDSSQRSSSVMDVQLPSDAGDNDSQLWGSRDGRASQCLSADAVATYQSYLNSQVRRPDLHASSPRLYIRGDDEPNRREHGRHLDRQLKDTEDQPLLFGDSPAPVKARSHESFLPVDRARGHGKQLSGSALVREGLLPPAQFDVERRAPGSPTPAQGSRIHPTTKHTKTVMDVSQSDESDVIPNRQQAHAVREKHAVPNHMPSVGRKPPRPGPAPTRALPSLPESNDDGGVRAGQKKGLPQGFSLPQIATVSSNDDLSEQPSRANTSASSRSALTAQRALVESPTIPGNADGSKASRKSREDRVRARKMRDLQLNRMKRENLKSGDGAGAVTKSPRHLDRASTHKSHKSDHSGAAGSVPSVGALSQKSLKLSGTGSFTSTWRYSGDGKVQGQAQMVSPVMVATKQGPLDARANGGVHYPRHVHRRRDVINHNPYVSRTSTPSNKSSDEAFERRKARRRLDGMDNASGSQGSGQSSRTLTKEAELESRITILERKNMLLEAALMAVLQGSAGPQSPLSSGSFDTGCGGGAPGGRGSRTSMGSGPSPLEVLIAQWTARNRHLSAS
ncbi:MAG: hypothetical protein M1817_001155 [Caeruleum heppii]|nr:MAG: hypothetical protein M1817_001155 [Caeruleum heppii]